MKQSTQKISTRELLPLVDEIIKSGKKAIITVSGNSMRPFIVSNRDKVLLGAVNNLKKADIILFKDKHGRYILHRIYRIKDDKCRTIGDYCLMEDGEVKRDDIIGVVEEIIRKGKKISCDSLLWRIYSHVWLALLPVRKYLIVMHKAYIRFKA
mgnify:FL=1